LQVQKEREKAWLAILLAGVAGVVDAVGYLLLVRLFTAHMSGNSVAMGLFFGQAQWAAALFRAAPIPLFVLGVTLGAVVIEVAARLGLRSLFAMVWGMEALLLLIFIASSRGLLHDGQLRISTTGQFYFLVALLAVSMGLQNATLQRVGGRVVRTTYVTGMLTEFSQESVKYLFWLYNHLWGRPRSHAWKVFRLSSRHVSFNRAMLFVSIWVSYVCGAIWGGYSEQRWELGSLAFPLCILTGIIILDLIHPIYIPSVGSVKTRLQERTRHDETPL
jgi:uncharacterized membrane protein YoaK (UPF0700 family)